jgi:signal recognition particle receptor subunit beta
VAESAHLYQNGAITAAQANQVRSIYDSRFQPAFRLAVAAAKADLSTAASPDLIALASQLSSLIIQFQNHTP